MTFQQGVHGLVDVAVPVTAAQLLERLRDGPAAARSIVAGARPLQRQEGGRDLKERCGCGVAEAGAAQALEGVAHHVGAFEVQVDARDRHGGLTGVAGRLEVVDDLTPVQRIFPEVLLDIAGRTAMTWSRFCEAEVVLMTTNATTITGSSGTERSSSLKERGCVKSVRGSFWARPRTCWA
ncbi:MAG: hypothetical protein L0H96_21715 [Humibacillus sp.]|nr:hypothetical protein [Humibacillus sp.]MDN5779514.1 hypothetical protein [Humibacillus sp.]